MAHELKTVFENTCHCLVTGFKKHFPEDAEKFAWIRVPFTANISLEFTSVKEANLTKPSCDKNLKTKLGNMKVFEFWISAKDENPLQNANLNGSQFSLRHHFFGRRVFGVFSENRQLPCENESGTGNECGGVLCDPKV